jgi:hypothetical protein
MQVHPVLRGIVMRNYIAAAVAATVALLAVGCASAPATTAAKATSAVSAAPSVTTTTKAATLTPAQRKYFHDLSTYVSALGASDVASVSIGNSVCAGRQSGTSQSQTIAEQTFPAQLSRAQRTMLVRLAEKDLCPKYLPSAAQHPAHSAAPVSLCGAPPSPYGLNLCGNGHLVYSPPANVCSYFNCIPNFPNGTGYMTECNDGMYSMSGGRQGACSYHGGESTAVTQG